MDTLNTSVAMTDYQALDAGALQRKLHARDKVIAVLKKRLAREQGAMTPLATLQQNVMLGEVVARKTRELDQERCELEDALAELGRTQAMLLQAQKMESIGQLASGIAHEINTPTQFVSDNVAFVSKACATLSQVLDMAGEFVERARVEGGHTEQVEAWDALLRSSRFAYVRQQVPEALEQSREGLSRISHIVSAMKSFSHPSAGVKEPVDMEALVATTVTVARNEWKYVAELETDIEPGLPQVPCLRDEIGQVLLNLVVNAAQAIGETLVPGKREIGHIRVQLRREGDYAELRVIDDGPGIPENIVGKVFDPFFTTKPVGKGTGQGLAIAYSTVVEKHRGCIRIEPTPGGGTTFVVALPLQARE